MLATGLGRRLINQQTHNPLHPTKPLVNDSVSTP